uniref:Secreted protein n=1 Tax=Macrostomum lignano TaxID=282301 RepID=A0A1I8G125_9PLAT
MASLISGACAPVDSLTTAWSGAARGCKSASPTSAPDVAVSAATAAASTLSSAAVLTFSAAATPATRLLPTVGVVDAASRTTANRIPEPAAQA